MQLTIPNRITLARIALVPVFVIVMLQIPESRHYRLVALGVFFVMAASDLLDGYLARRLGQFSRLGRILDPVADKLLVDTTYVLFALMARQLDFPTGMPRALAVLAVLVVCRDLYIAIGFFVLHHLVVDASSTRPNLLGKGTTGLQCTTALVLLIDPYAEMLLAPTAVKVILWVLVASTAAATLASGIQYTRTGLHLLAHEQE